MDSVKIRELEEKTSLNPTDVVVIEDYDGTKVVSVLNLQSAVQKALFFNTVDDMKAATLNEGDVVRTLGYHSINDGGAATYVIQYAPAEVDNGITILYLDTSDTLRAHLVYNDSISPMQAGAYGDGVHNDYSILNKMVKMNLNINFPAKNFYIGENLYLKLNSDTKVNFNNATLSGTGGIQLGLDNACDDVYISNLTFKGTSIRLDNKATRIHISDCKFYTNTGIEIHGSDGIYISNCIFGTNANPVETPIYMNSGSNLDVSNCSFEFTKIGINIATYPCQSATVDNWASNINITNCNFTATGNSKSYGIRVGSVKKVTTISNCSIYKAGTAIGLNPNAQISMSISDISMSDCPTGISTDGGATASTAILHLSGMIEFINNTGTFAYVFGVGGAKIINDASYRLDTSERIRLGLSRSNNTVYTKESYTTVGDELYVGTTGYGLLDLGASYITGDCYPLFDASIIVNSSNYYIKNITTVDPSHTSVGYKGYTGQVLSLYSRNGTTLYVNRSDGNIKLRGSLATYLQLYANKPVKIKYNGAYWYVIEY